MVATRSNPMDVAVLSQIEYHTEKTNPQGLWLSANDVIPTCAEDTHSPLPQEEPTAMAETKVKPRRRAGNQKTRSDDIGHRFAFRAQPDHLHMLNDIKNSLNEGEPNRIPIYTDSDAARVAIEFMHKRLPEIRQEVERASRGQV